MQIHELNPKSQIEEGIADRLSAIFSKDPALAGLSSSQKAAAIKNNKQIAQVSDMAFNQWLQKNVNLIRANGGQELTPKDYADELRAYVSDRLLPSYVDYNSLTTRGRLDQAITQAAQNKDDKNILKQKFDDIVDLATVSRAATSPAQKQQQQKQQAQQPQAPASPQNKAAAQKEINSLVSQTMNDKQAQMLQQYFSQVAPTTVKSTGNPYADSLLNYLGVKTR